MEERVSTLYYQLLPTGHRYIQTARRFGLPVVALLSPISAHEQAVKIVLLRIYHQLLKKIYVGAAGLSWLWWVITITMRWER